MSQQTSQCKITTNEPEILLNIVRSLSKVLEVPLPGRDFFSSNILVRTKHLCCSMVGVPHWTKNDPEQKLKCVLNFKTIQNFTTN